MKTTAPPIVIADASPIRYLVSIEFVDILPGLYGQVTIPPAVLRELDHERMPPRVRDWMNRRPEWLLVRAPSTQKLPLPHGLGAGEREAIALAVEVAADALLMDDRDGRREAQRSHVAAVGTLRILADAAEHGLADLHVAVERLRRTNFRADERLLQHLLERIPGT